MSSELVTHGRSRLRFILGHMYSMFSPSLAVLPPFRSLGNFQLSPLPILFTCCRLPSLANLLSCRRLPRPSPSLRAKEGYIFHCSEEVHVQMPSLNSVPDRALANFHPSLPLISWQTSCYSFSSCRQSPFPWSFQGCYKPSSPEILINCRRIALSTRSLLLKNILE